MRLLVVEDDKDINRQLTSALEAAGIHPIETDLAELIIQLGHDQHDVLEPLP